LAAQGKQKSALISSLLEDEKYQRDAFAALVSNLVGLNSILQFIEFVSIVISFNALP